MATSKDISADISVRNLIRKLPIRETYALNIKKHATKKARFSTRRSDISMKDITMRSLISRVLHEKKMRKSSFLVKRRSKSEERPSKRKLTTKRLSKSFLLPDSNSPVDSEAENQEPADEPLGMATRSRKVGRRQTTLKEFASGVQKHKDRATPAATPVTKRGKRAATTTVQEFASAISSKRKNSTAVVNISETPRRPAKTTRKQTNLLEFSSAINRMRNEDRNLEQPAPSSNLPFVSSRRETESALQDHQSPGSPRMGLSSSDYQLLSNLPKTPERRVVRGKRPASSISKGKRSSRIDASGVALPSNALRHTSSASVKAVKTSASRSHEAINFLKAKKVIEADGANRSNSGKERNTSATVPNDTLASPSLGSARCENIDPSRQLRASIVTKQKTPSERSKINTPKSADANNEASEHDDLFNAPSTSTGLGNKAASRQHHFAQTFNETANASTPKSVDANNANIFRSNERAKANKSRSAEMNADDVTADREDLLNLPSTSTGGIDKTSRQQHSRSAIRTSNERSNVNVSKSMDKNNEKVNSVRDDFLNLPLRANVNQSAEPDDENVTSAHDDLLNLPSTSAGRENAGAGVTSLPTVSGLKRKTVPKKGPKTCTPFSVNQSRALFQHFVEMPVERDALPLVDEAVEKFFANTARDLAAYAHHAGRKTVLPSDVILLMKRQRFITKNHSLQFLADKYLPMEYREQIIPCAGRDGEIYP